MSWLSRLSHPLLFGALFAVAAVVLGLIVATVVSTRDASTSQPLYLEQAANAGHKPFVPVAKDRARPTAGQGCDTEALITQLTRDPDRAAASLSAAGRPNEALPGYIRALRPQQLSEDTRVTNYQYDDGGHVAVQSVPQRGTAVPVDAAGEPKARCASGNPLGAPTQLKSQDKWDYVGTAWPRSKPPTVVIVEKPIEGDRGRTVIERDRLVLVPVPVPVPVAPGQGNRYVTLEQNLKALREHEAAGHLTPEQVAELWRLGKAAAAVAPSPPLDANGQPAPSACPPGYTPHPDNSVVCSFVPPAPTQPCPNIPDIQPGILGGCVPQAPPVGPAVCPPGYTNHPDNNVVCSPVPQGGQVPTSPGGPVQGFDRTGKPCVYPSPGALWCWPTQDGIPAPAPLAPPAPGPGAQGPIIIDDPRSAVPKTPVEQEPVEQEPVEEYEAPVEEYEAPVEEAECQSVDDYGYCTE